MSTRSILEQIISHVEQQVGQLERERNLLRQKVAELELRVGGTLPVMGQADQKIYEGPQPPCGPSEPDQIADHKQNPCVEADFDQHYRDLQKDEKAGGLNTCRGVASMRALRRMYFAGRIDGARAANSTQGPG